MKKQLAILLAAALVLSLAACGGSSTPDSEASPPASAASTPDAGKEHIHTEEVLAAVEPTCTATGLTEGKRCTECGEILVAQETLPALGHTTDTGTCERCGLSFGIWGTSYYIDEFKQPTENWYIVNSNLAMGSFSNSATTNSDLAVYVTYDYQNRIAFVLYEYGRTQVKNVWDTDTYSIIMRTADGTDHDMKGYIYKNGDRLILDENYVDDVISALTGEGQISFYMQSGRMQTTKYLFTIEASNFADEYNAIMGR